MRGKATMSRQFKQLRPILSDLKNYLLRTPVALSLLAAALILGTLLLRQTAVSTFAGQPDEPYRTGEESTGRIALQCNVAWGQENLPAMLKILEEANVHITFNILGEWAEKFPDDLRMIAQAGHELGNHGYYHKNHSELTAEQVQQEIRRADQVIFDITGQHTTIFAPPSGDHDRESVRAAQELGVVVVLWSIDTIDWKREGVDATLKRVFRDPKAGDIILMHPLPDTVTALPEIISGLRELGLEPCTVGELLPDPPED